MNHKDIINRRILSMMYALAVVISIILILRTNPYQSEQAVSPEVEKGIDFLSALERKDPAEVDNIVLQRQKEHMAAQLEEEHRIQLISDIKNDTIDIWSVFNDYVILGDSRALGFSYYKFLEYRRVMAAGGNTIRNVTEHTDEIKNIDPSYIYICYGLNDIGIGFWKTSESYAAEVVEVVQELQKELPNAKIIVSSILPAAQEGLKKNPAWKRVPEFNAAVESACAENGIIFADNDEISAEYNETLWQPDGIHLRVPFYKYWGKNLMLAALEG